MIQKKSITFSIFIALSNKIGGKRIIKNISLNPSLTTSNIKFSPRYLKINPANIPYFIYEFFIIIKYNLLKL